MKASEARRWLEYAEKDLRAAHALLDSGEFFRGKYVFRRNRQVKKP